MGLKQATLVEPTTKKPEPVFRSQDNAVPLRLAARVVPDRVQRVIDLAAMVLQEVEILARDKTFAEQTARKSLDVARGIDFYDEVKRFETGLIRMALERTNGNQAKAAALLSIRPTTLNSKIKHFGIESYA